MIVWIVCANASKKLSKRSAKTQMVFSLQLKIENIAWFSLIRFQILMLVNLSIVDAIFNLIFFIKMVFYLSFIENSFRKQFKMFAI